MATQQQAAELYRDTQAAAADAWALAVDHHTAYMHSDRLYDPQAADDAAQAEALADWNRKHPNARPLRLGAGLVLLGALALYAVGLVTGVLGIFLAVTNRDGRWLAASLLGWLVACLVWRGLRRGRA